MFGTHSVCSSSLNTTPPPPDFIGRKRKHLPEGLCKKKKKKENNFSLLFLFNRACENISPTTLTTPHCQGPELRVHFAAFAPFCFSPSIICLHLHTHGFGCFTCIFISPKSKVGASLLFHQSDLTDGSFFICQCNAMRSQKCFSHMPAKYEVGQTTLPWWLLTYTHTFKLKAK